MNHLKTYKEFDTVNEELTRDQRLYLNIPRFLVAFITSEVINQYPMLNFRWNELKRSTKKSGYDSLFSSPSVETLKDNIKKVSKKDLPKNRLGLGMFLRDWNVYLSDRKSKGGEFGPKAVERPIVYLSKDDIKVGDKFAGYRINDNDIFPDFKKQIKPKNLEEYPIVVLIAKFDRTEKLKDINQCIDDISLELEDEFPLSAEPSSNPHGDKFHIPIKITNSRKEIQYSEDLFSKLEEVAERVKDYLNNTEGYKNINYSIDLALVGPFYYHITPRSMGRFGEIIEAAKEYTRTFDHDSEDPMYDKHRGILNISKIWSSGDERLRLHPDDIRKLISDLDYCYKCKITPGTATHTSEKFKINIEDIKFRSISIRFY